MINCHIIDGVALTKFLFWIKKVNKKQITELDAQKKLRNLEKNHKITFIQALILLLEVVPMQLLFTIEQQRKVRKRYLKMKFFYVIPVVNINMEQLT